MILSLPGGSDNKESASNAGDLGSIPGLGRFPWRRGWQPTPEFLPGESHGQRSLEGHSPWGLKESDIFHFMILRFTFSLNGFYLLGILTEMIMVSGVCFKIA